MIPVEEHAALTEALARLRDEARQETAGHHSGYEEPLVAVLDVLIEELPKHAPRGYDPTWCTRCQMARARCQWLRAARAAVGA